MDTSLWLPQNLPLQILKCNPTFEAWIQWMLGWTERISVIFLVPRCSFESLTLKGSSVYYFLWNQPQIFSLETDGHFHLYEWICIVLSHLREEGKEGRKRKREEGREEERRRKEGRRRMGGGKRETLEGARGHGKGNVAESQHPDSSFSTEQNSRS